MVLNKLINIMSEEINYIQLRLLYKIFDNDDIVSFDFKENSAFIQYELNFGINSNKLENIKKIKHKNITLYGYKFFKDSEGMISITTNKLYIDLKKLFDLDNEKRLEFIKKLAQYLTKLVYDMSDYIRDLYDESPKCVPSFLSRIFIFVNKDEEYINLNNSLLGYLHSLQLYHSYLNKDYKESTLEIYIDYISEAHPYTNNLKGYLYEMSLDYNFFKYTHESYAFTASLISGILRVLQGKKKGGVRNEERRN